MLLDSNLIIYAAQPEHAALRTFIAREAPYVSAVSKVETLGYHEIGKKEKQFLNEFFDAAEVLSVSQSVIDEAIRLIYDQANTGASAGSIGRSSKPCALQSRRYNPALQMTKGFG